MDADRNARPAKGASLDSEELAQLATEVLAKSPFPALVVSMPSAKIVAASPHAIELLNPEGGKVLGRLLQEFDADWPAGAGDLFARGRLNGLETSLTLHRTSDDEQLFRMWVRPFDGQPISRFLLAVLVPQGARSAAPTELDWSDAPTVVGTTDASLLIERISSDAEDLFGQSVSDLIGRSLLGLLEASHVSPFLVALGDAFSSRQGVTLEVDIRSRVEPQVPAERHTCEALVIPLEPSPSCAFVLLPISPAASGAHQPGTDVPGMLFRLGLGAEVANLARGILTHLPVGAVPGIEKLSTRELQIIAPLLDGDRPPAIAANLYLSQSTVRNHLSSIYAKLGVSSQQELMNAFRSVTPAKSPPDLRERQVHGTS
ncbi:MAG: LuxR C-terminal-related transcriptional regulator [Actinomycetota bacterium]|nr:LuxR C-terminal-related transcriptional regulator [Actinomycetota bacterium]